MAKKNENLEALRDAMIVRKKVTNVLKVLALQTQSRLEALEDDLAKATTDEERSAITKKIQEERFNTWLIEKECDLVSTNASELSGNLRVSNTIWPAYMAEFAERRVLMDRAMGACNVLQDELQYIAEAVYADKNKFTALVLEIEALFNKIKSLRQADNRFLRQLKDNVNQKV